MDVKEDNVCSFTKEDLDIHFYYIEGDWLSKSWLKGNFYEFRLLDKLRELQLEGTYIDVGAHFGNHSIYFSKFCPCNKVISIDGNPINYKFLESNIKINKCLNVITHNKIVSNVDDKTYKMLTYIRNTGVSRIIYENEHRYNSKSNVENTSITLDKLLKEEKNITLIKFDVELHEFEALQGCIETIKKYKPVIIIENHKNTLNYDKINDFLTTFKYKTDEINYAQNTKIYIHSN